LHKSTINQGSTKTSDWAFFNPNLTRLHVVKDIFAAAANDSSLPARATVIDQSFSQTNVPEPMSAAIALLATLFTAGFFRGRRFAS
jgi:hypothetical protein